MIGHILIVEDDRDMCEMLDVGLSRRGFTTCSYVSGLEGVAAIDLEQPDVILTDINLPDVSGMQVCREVVAKWQEIPVIMMTAFGSMETAIEAIRVGAYDFITKPLDMDILAVALQRAVDHRNLKQQVQVLSEAFERIHSFSGLARREQGHERSVFPAGANCRYRNLGAHHRREWVGQGAHRQGPA